MTDGLFRIMKKYSAVLASLILSLGVMPINASAATVYLESTKNAMAVGDTAVLTLKINTSSTTINVVEGNVRLESTGDTIEVQEFSLANSALGLWPRTPSLSKDSKVVSFVGGIPGGFNAEGAILFKIIVQALQEGSVTMSPQDIVTFANDGSGIRLPASGRGITIQVGPRASTPPSNDWEGVVSSDETAPEDFTIVTGNDQSVFDGKTFAFFSAIDNQSGINYYEVSEDGAPAVRSGSTYVLINQSGTATLEVTAVDKAGNRKIARYPEGAPSGPAEDVPAEASLKGVVWLSVIATLLLIGIGASLYKKRFKK